MPREGELVLLVNAKGKRYMRRVELDKQVHTHDGWIDMQTIADAEFGETVKTHMGKPYRLIRPTIYELVKGVKRQTQIIYPKDIGYICMRLGIGPGVRVIEAGSGSGSLTTALSWFAGETGTVYTYEARPEFYNLCRRNLDWAGLGQNVIQHNRNIEEGFEQNDADALFLDVRTPWDYLHHVAAAVSPGAPLGFLLPTANQVCNLLEGLDNGPFSDVEVVEILVRRYKTVHERFRPDDRMVAHTGYLVFARYSESARPASAKAPAASEAESPAVETAQAPMDDIVADVPAESVENEE